MSSLRNAVSRRAHKERAQPESRKNFGLLEKHKDYVERAKAYHKKEEIYGLKEKAFFRNPDEFNFKMIKTRTVDGVHKLESRANEYTLEELLLMKTQDIGYIFQKVQNEKKETEKLIAILHSLDNRPSSRHVYFAEDRKTAGSYRVLEGRRKRVNELEKIYMDMAMQKELEGKKRKLCEDEIVSPTSNAVCKWRAERNH